MKSSTNLGEEQVHIIGSDATDHIQITSTDTMAVTTKAASHLVLDELAGLDHCAGTGTTGIWDVLAIEVSIICDLLRQGFVLVHYHLSTSANPGFPFEDISYMFLSLILGM